MAYSLAVAFIALCVIVSSPAAASDGDAALRLTPDEAQFVKDHPVIRVRLNADIPPFLFQDDDTPVGMTVDVLDMAAAKLGVSIQPILTMTFSEALKGLPTGDGLDMQPLIRKTPERADKFLFTRPYMDFPLVIVTRNSMRAIVGLEDMAGKSVAVERGYWYGDEMKRLFPEIKQSVAADTSAAIAAVAAGDVDAYIGSLPAATWHIESRGYANLKIAAPAPELSSAQFSMAIRQDWPLMASAFDRAIAELTEDEIRHIRQHWLSPRYEYGISRSDAFLWGGMVLAVAFVLISGFAFANRKLAREVALRKAAEDQVRANDATSRELLNASSDACMLIDIDGVMLGSNKVFAERFGATPQTVIGRILWDFFPTDLAEQRKAAVAAVAASGIAATTLDVRGDRHLSNTIYPLKDDMGAVRRIAVYSRDITDQIQSEQKIKEYVAEIERSNEDLEQFAYVASHDLREPLRQVAGFVALLDRNYGPKLDDDARQFIAFARDGAMRMDNLVLDLLEFSRIGRGSKPTRHNSVDIINTALANLGAPIAETGAAIHIPHTLPEINGVGSELQSLFQNLIGNALKYRRPDAAPHIRIEAEDLGDFVRFCVVDNGIGIETEYFERIFGIFQRLHNQAGVEGTGIGLAVCRRIVEKHGGRIWPDSVLGQGSRFFFTLPKAD